jgi:hypothetical protein
MAYMSVLYPVAANAEAALSAPLGRAARERDALGLAGAVVSYQVEETGPAFATREQALDAFVGRIEDDRPGKPAIAAEDRYLELRQVVARQGGRIPVVTTVRPNYEGGRRWPERTAAAEVATVWRVSVAYWRVHGERAAPGQARQVRKTGQGPVIGRDVLAELSQQPLRPFKPQQPLDIGLFETPLPEAPGQFIADE